MFQENLLLAFLLTLLAGLATGVGSFFAFFTKRTNTKVLSASLGFSAGVMIYVSFAEILPESRASLHKVYPDQSEVLAVLAFFSGIFLIGLIDRLVPDFGNPHEVHGVEDMQQLVHRRGVMVKDSNLLRTGILSGVAIAIHNFPEGIATFFTTLQDPTLGWSIAIAIAIHNVPEGVAVAMPIFFATGKKKRAFFYSFLTGFAEPLGALIGFAFLSVFYSPIFLGVTLGAVAGIMVFISLDELLPAAEKFGEHHLSVYGVVAGMALMAVSLLMLE
jgi:ZIP family zinc transporter